MTVRWKPLLLLSGLFAMTAVVGVIAMAVTLIPRGAADVLPKARAERTARQYEKAEIYYKQARQMDGKNPAVHEELASLYADWAERATPEKRATLKLLRFASLADAARFGKTLREPRKQLLAVAIAQDEIPESLHWAKEVLALEPNNADAHYVMAYHALDDHSTAAALDDESRAAQENHTRTIPEVKRHLKALEAARAPEVRVLWLKARLARVMLDNEACEAALARSRLLTLPEGADPVDRMALVRLRELDVETNADPSRVADRVEALQAEAKSFVAGPEVAPNQVMRLNLLLERVQRTLTQAAAKADPAAKARIEGLIDSVEKVVESIFRQALDAVSKTDLHVYLTYAEHLRFRGKRDRCLGLVDQGLKSPLAALPASHEVVMCLHAVAVEAALNDAKDPGRLDKAAPHIKSLIASTAPKFQGMGHLFQGAIELEESGVVGAPADGAPAPGRAAEAATQAKLRSSALNHLKLAAAQLPDAVEAQARYGVALILNQELNLGRQYLQAAMRKGDTEPQYQIWAAYSIVQAGYPEEAEPVVNHLLAGVPKGLVPRELEGTLHLLSGEIHQARRTPDELKKALAEYARSYDGKTPPPAVQIRMAQIDVQLGQGGEALKRIEQLRALGQGGAATEHLAVLTLLEGGKVEAAREALAAARRAYPASDDLVGLDAALLAKDGKPAEADKVLAEFLAREPGSVSAALMRAQVLTDLLDDTKEARRLLADVAERSENSAPLVQLALLDLRQKDYDAVNATIARIRSRWKEAAAADLLDAQVALDQGNLSEAAVRFDAALKKDPGNKIVQFWKAQLDSRLGAASEASQAFESLAKDGSTKQLDTGLSLAAAARSALANLALQNNDYEGAIRRFESLRAGGNLSGLARGDRWQLVSAYAAKGQWAAARKEIASLLNDPGSPASNDERVRAANYYRLNGDDAAAVAQLDYVLKNDPAQPSAVVTRAYMLSESKRVPEAIALIRGAIAFRSKPAPPAVFYLLLAALENAAPPEAGAAGRAMAALDEGLAAQPKAPELVQAKYRLLAATDGPKAAVSYVESEARGDTRGTMLRMLAGVYRDQKDYASAEQTLRDLVKKNPKEPGLAATLVRVVATQAVLAGEKGDRDLERTLNDKSAGLIRQFRAAFPNELIFLQEDCDLAYRKGETSQAVTVTNEIDQVSKNSPAGPLLRARIFTAQGRTRDAAEAYAEALRRNPAQPDVRVLLGQARMALGEPDEAVRQARLVLETDRDRGDAVLLEARALAQPSGDDAQAAGRRARAAEILSAALKKNPRFTAAYHQLAEVRLQEGRRDEAAAALRAGLDAVPDDAVGLARLVELLAGPAAPGAGADPAGVAAAEALASAVGGRDTKGQLMLALAVGFHKAGRLDAARDWAAKAAATLDVPAVHLNYGDILLSIAERGTGDDARADFRRAVDQYDLVLKTQANSVEAVNNKAWILYRYLGENQKALALAEGLLGRADPSTLPGEFFDTLGAIQEAVGRARDAEDSYNRGLRKSPDNPVLNYHMGKLIVSDTRRAAKALDYLEKARASRDRLTPAMAAEVDTLVARVRRN